MSGNGDNGGTDYANGDGGIDDTGDIDDTGGDGSYPELDAMTDDEYMQCLVEAAIADEAEQTASEQFRALVDGRRGRPGR